MGKSLKTTLGESAGTSTRDAVETAIESSKGDRLTKWEEFVDSESDRISRWFTADEKKSENVAPATGRNKSAR